jgi:ABC-type tungstate transport system substrate-binding protein
MILAICLSIIYSAVLAGSSERMKRFIIVVVSCRVSCRVVSVRLMTFIELEKGFQFIH